MNDEGHREAPWEDQIVAEVRAARAALLGSAGNDLAVLVERLRQEQARSGGRVVSLPPRAPEPTAGEAA
jgi:hypothetical protein